MEEKQGHGALSFLYGGVQRISGGTGRGLPERFQKGQRNQIRPSARTVAVLLVTTRSCKHIWARLCRYRVNRAGTVRRRPDRP